MAIEQKGPGGVNASYGKRVTENSFDVTKTYDQGLYVNSSGGIVGPDGQPVGGGGVVAEYTICPSDNPATSYDLKLTGANDDQAITAFLASLVVSASDSKPALIRFLSGNYNLTSEIVINNSWITFAGPNRPFWRKFNGPYGGGGTMSTPGTRGGAVINQTVNGKGVFIFGTNFLTGEESSARWRGIEFRDLMFNGVIGGAASTGTAILDTSGATDRVVVDKCLFMGFATGIKAGWDSPIITRCDFQSLGTGYGVWITNQASGIAGALPDVSHNIFFDSGCVGVRIDPVGGKVVGNVFGNLAKDCVQIGGAFGVVSANTVRNTYAGFCKLYNYTGAAPGAVSITGNTVCLVDYNNRNTSPFSSNASSAVTIGGAGAVNDIGACVVEGNTFVRFGTTTAPAIYINSGSGTLPTGVRANYIGVNGYDGNLGGGTGWNAGNANPNTLPTGTVIASTTTV